VAEAIIRMMSSHSAANHSNHCFSSGYSHQSNAI